MAFGVDRYAHADVLAINIKGRTDGHGIDRVVLTLDQFRLAHNTIHWDVEAVIILRRKSEDSKCAIVEPLRILRIGIAEETCHTELAALDPDTLGILETVENDRATIGGADDDIRVIGRGARSSVGLQFTVKELVEGLELIGWQLNFTHIQLMEVDEAGDLRRRGRVVKLAALLKGQGAKQLASCALSAVPSRNIKADDDEGQVKGAGST